MATKRPRPNERVSLGVEGLAADETPVVEVRAPAMPWLAAALFGGVLCALAGWLLVVAPVGLVWLTAPVGQLSGALGLGTQVWLLAHGAGATLDKLHVTLVPLGLTAVLVVMVVGVSGWSARQAQLGFPDDDLPYEERRRITGRVTLSLTASYSVAVALTSYLTSTPQQTARALAGAVLLSGTAAAVGSARAVGWRPGESWPLWVRLVPRSAGAALLTVLVGSAAVLATALARSAARITALSDSVGADLVGQLALLGAQVAYLPTLLLWCGSWLLGAGFTLGDSSVVSPMWTQVGLLPAIPVGAAVPDASYGRWINLTWMLGGVLAGAAAAWVAGRGRRVRFDEQALVGGVAGVVAGFAFTLVALASRGDLGVGRLVGLGPRPVELAVMAPTLLGLSGMVTGLVLGLLRRPEPAVAAGEVPPPALDLTQPLRVADDPDATRDLPRLLPGPDGLEPSRGLSRILPSADEEEPDPAAGPVD